MNTTFAIVSTFAIRENYGAHDWDGKGECPQYWKQKGTVEVEVATEIPVSHVTEFNKDVVHKMVAETAPENDEYYHHTLIDYALEERSENTLKQIKSIIENSDWNDYHYHLYNAPEYGFTEKTMEWGLRELCARGEIEISGNGTFQYIKVNN